MRLRWIIILLLCCGFFSCTKNKPFNRKKKHTMQDSLLFLVFRGEDAAEKRGEYLFCQAIRFSFENSSSWLSSFTSPGLRSPRLN